MKACCHRWAAVPGVSAVSLRCYYALRRLLALLLRLPPAMP